MSYAFVYDHPPVRPGCISAAMAFWARTFSFYNQLGDIPYSSPNWLARPLPRSWTGRIISKPMAIRVDKSRSLRRYSDMGRLLFGLILFLANQYLARCGGSLQPYSIVNVSTCL